MHGGEGDCCVVVVGAGAGGALTASHLVTGLSARFRVELVDPAPATGRGTAYSTTDDRHLLNVPASGMSAFPRDPEHFFRWVRQHHDPQAQPQDFVPRRVYGDYVEGLLRTAAEYPGNARLVRRQARSSASTGAATGSSCASTTASEATIVARAVVLATGARPGTDWAPDGARRRPAAWSPTRGRDELPDGDLLLVGTGLTMVDVAIAADRPGPHPAHASRATTPSPRAHVLPTTPPVPPPPGITRLHTLDDLRAAVAAHVERTVAETGDWRAAIDGLRPVTAQLWRGLSRGRPADASSPRTRAPGTSAATGCRR